MTSSMGDAHIEIRIHGRGGQGAVTLAALLADAAFRSGWYPLAFPAFGTERTGAPVAAFVRLDRNPVRDRSEVRRPTYVVVQDPGLVGVVDVLAGMTPNGLVLLDAERIPPALAAAPVIAIGATKLALAHLGVAKTSTAMLGFLAAATGVVTPEAGEAAILERFPGRIGERNVALARAAFDAVIPMREIA